MERCQLEIFIEKYFDLDEKTTTEKTLITTDFGQLVNMLSMFKEREKKDIESSKPHLPLGAVIGRFNHELIEKIRNSQSDAEARRYIQLMLKTCQ